ncbi:MAG: hypothetical protein KME28_07315 [Pelatocladus maniniholoensis HA4357-MV3]|jgi:hypothetical protein|uniref:Uncharacterized protein n=1 Tax=Pelatocladus maniniholoensis HA4357-MV3 TaxID=1117104 RepID=A0A9E3H6A0_9NOST|nr:hypothetical protein [Pelatocladus maniniholoensis HA4357-MV3]
MTKYFTVKTIHYSGLTDQLGTQFSRLYSLGCVCQYEYVYTPFSFPRSHGYIGKERLIRKSEKLIFSTFPWIYQLWFTRKVMTKILNLLYKFLYANASSKSNKDEVIANFLGFYNFENQINDDKFKDYKLITIDLHQILESSSITNILHLKHIIEDMSSYPYLIYEFVCTDKMHPFLDRIDFLLKKSELEIFEFSSHKLSENYWKARKEKQIVSGFTTVSDEKIHLVAHIRLGDSISIHLPQKTLYVNGDCVFNSDNESDVKSIEKIFNVDPNRRAVDIYQYKNFLVKTFEIWGRENIFCSIISDGYERTFNVIRNYLKQGKLKLSTTEMRQLQDLEKSLNDDFNDFIRDYSDTSIVSESLDNLLKSIHYLASAKVVIWGTGGFAFYTHKLFKKHDNFSMIFHVKDQSDEIFKEMTNLKFLIHP